MMNDPLDWIRLARARERIRQLNQDKALLILLNILQFIALVTLYNTEAK